MTDIFPSMMQERAELWYRKEYIWGTLNEKTVSPNVKSIRVDGLCAVEPASDNKIFIKTFVFFHQRQVI